MSRIHPSQKKAIEIAVKVFSKLRLSSGQTEIDIANQIKTQLARYGARPSFRIIVASGKRSALPHGFATRKKIQRGDLVVIDFGAVYNEYRSDLTRTKVAGKFTQKQRKIYSIVKKAQEEAVKMVKANQTCSDVDRAAREYIKAKGYGKYFIHTTGHGITKKVHAAPKISSRNKNKLKVGTVITIEPGIYIKGWGGVRIEDMFLVTKNGCKVLSR